MSPQITFEGLKSSPIYLIISLKVKPGELAIVLRQVHLPHAES